MKKTILLSIVFVLSYFMVWSQDRIPVKGPSSREKDGYTEKVSHTGRLTSLVAKFSADVRYGVKPLVVHFTDESEGNPVAWVWNFGDGTTSTEQNPSHEYVTEGNYTVSLNVSDGTNTFTLEKENYITVLSELPTCDTLDYPFAGTYTYYIDTAGVNGYVSGNNKFQDKAKANYFSDYPEKVEIQGLLLEFAVVSSTSGSNPQVTFAVWDNSGPQGSPGVIKITASLPLSQVVEDVSNNTFTYVQFDDPLYITAPFYAGVILPITVGDTVALWTDTDGDAAPGIGWEQWSDGQWLPYSDPTNGWNLKISNAIFPIVCASSQGMESLLRAENILIYPNPATDQVTVKFDRTGLSPVKISLYNIMGGLMNTTTSHLSPSSVTIPLDGYTRGLYFIIIEAGNQKITRKIHVI
ncbi:MAG TPA: PKD domain-containing protein [Bacteroidales bacterium]|nr:PKD domain-containing protein [Bacteroidales bacterium]HRZ21503.1 PKD domain-containing protein [Bacteroidales bacterium]